MASTGLRLIVVAEQRARQSGHRLVIVQGPPWVQRLFEVTGIDQWLDVRSDPPDCPRHVDPAVPPEPSLSGWASLNQPGFFEVEFVLDPPLRLG